MHRYHRMGRLPRKRHIVFPKEGGGIYYEELIGNKGFDGPSTLLYHIHSPTSVRSTKIVGEWVLEEDTDKTLRMRHFFSTRLPKGGSATLDRIPLLFNDDVTVSLASPDRCDAFFYRNSQADEILYVSEGEGTLESLCGSLRYGPGDYLVIPRGIIHRLHPDANSAQRLLVIEGRGEVCTPRRYRNEYGQLIERSPFSERDFRVPEELVTIDLSEDTALVVKQRNVFTEVIYNHHPFDVVGWDGYFYPYALNIHDFEPIVGRTHEPPPVHQTFHCDNFVICSFCPRPYDFDKEAIPAPYNHANVMSDEAIFYAKENFMSRKGVEYGSITLHPDGLTHGPHPGKMEESIGKTFTDELAVMVDTFYPLKVARQALEVEDPHYVTSWLDIG